MATIELENALVFTADRPLPFGTSLPEGANLPATNLTVETDNIRRRHGISRLPGYRSLLQLPATAVKTNSGHLPTTGLPGDDVLVLAREPLELIERLTATAKRRAAASPTLAHSAVARPEAPTPPVTRQLPQPPAPRPAARPARRLPATAGV